MRVNGTWKEGQEFREADWNKEEDKGGRKLLGFGGQAAGRLHALGIEYLMH